MGTCAKEVVDYLKLVPACAERRQEIDHVKTKSADILLPSTCNKAFWRCMDSLNKCKVTCEDLRRQRITGKLWYAKSNVERVEKLDKELSFAVQTMGLFCDCILNAKVDSISEALRKVNKCVVQCGSDTNKKIDEAAKRLEQTIHPDIGVYRGVSHGSIKMRPKAPDKPNVTVQDDLMVVKWNYAQCPPLQQIGRYEVQLDCGPILEGDFTNLDKEDSYSYSVSLGSPKITAGHSYTFQVRAIFKDGGPSEWSQPAVCGYKTGPPNKPQKPTVTMKPPKEGITIAIEPPKENDENGYPVQKCIVVIDDDEFPYSLDEFKNPVTISAEPDKTLFLKVIMVNEAGRSPPSDAVEVTTPELLPGVPVNVRISSTRKCDSIKIRWDRPDENAEAAFMYDVEMIRSKQKQPIEWNIVKHNVKKLYARVDQLNSNTKYKFRVRALNSKGHALPDQWSDVVEAETRHVKGVAALAATGAFIGGTLGGPVLGVMTIGGVSGMAAALNVDSEAGSKAAGVAAGIGGGIAGGFAGIVGAPLFGVGSAVLAYNAVSGNLPTSPPTSEDESPESSKSYEPPDYYMYT